jgi:hypothetical protein
MVQFRHKFVHFDLCLHLHADEGSEEFNAFLAILGDKVKLKGFDKYDGGLDTMSTRVSRHSPVCSLC